MAAISRYSLECSHYSIQSSKLTNDVRVVHLSDLHNSVFGENNEKLVSMVKEQEPDLILMTGDLVNARTEDSSVVLRLIRQCVKLAPVYVSLGNHELEHENHFGTDLVKLYEDAGAVVLDKEYRDIEVKGQKLRLGGIYGYCLPEKYLSTGEARKAECAFLQEFQDTDRYTILMCHMPVSWILGDGLDEWNVDCVFSGHMHGGQVILPGIGGLYGPDFGWFPGRLEGVYHSSDERKTLILSRGLGSNEKIPRFNNIPEVVTADLVSELRRQ